MQPIIDHIQITVRDMDAAAAFYDQLLPLLGFDLRHRVDRTYPEHDFRVVDYTHPRLGFAITSPRTAFTEDLVHRRKPGSLHHLAFRAESREQVDALHAELLRIGATIVSGPQLHPEYSPDYYAVFWKDPDGIKFELVCNEAVSS